MSVPKRLACDLDEVCSDFTGAFIREANKVLSLGLPETLDWSDWDIAKALGITKAQEAVMWDHIKGLADFNDNLGECRRSPGFVSFLNAQYEARRIDVTFVTARMEHRVGDPAQRQTARWLARHGFPHAAVIVTFDKVPVIQALKADALIDDKFETCRDVKKAMGEDIQVFMPVYAYNFRHVEDAKGLGIVLVDSGFEAIDILFRT